MRELLSYVLIGVVVVFVSAAGWAAYQFLLPSPPIVAVGDVSDFPPGEPVYVAEAEAQVWVVNTDNAVIAFDPRTTHPSRKCLLRWEEAHQIFRDPCLGTAFRLDGRYQEGPAPRGMDRFAVTLVDGEVRVDLSTVILGRPAHCEPHVVTSRGSYYTIEDRSTPWEKYRFVPEEEKSELCD